MPKYMQKHRTEGQTSADSSFYLNRVQVAPVTLFDESCYTCIGNSIDNESVWITPYITFYLKRDVVWRKLNYSSRLCSRFRPGATPQCLVQVLVSFCHSIWRVWSRGSLLFMRALICRDVGKIDSCCLNSFATSVVWAN